MCLLFGFKRTEAQHVIKMDKRDSSHGSHNLIPHCSTTRRRRRRRSSFTASWDGSSLCYCRHVATDAADAAETAVAGEAGRRRRRRR
ncbi:hypothetical protein PAHAL_1G091500 [Panicum hallii]|uniref:Uncharacterized protein n=1 Tax=Panicum hallii TaxID=206008 RepID=A0A2S3GMQ1_9POAL|nr:hypothetical protein PAHAL_1G091500 [Panicum hallii]